LWRWCFIVGFIILGPVSIIIGIVYRTIYKRRLWAAWRSTTAPS